MAIFGTNNNYAMEYPQYAMNGSEAEFDSIMTESYKDAYRLEAGMYVADVMMEEQVLTEGASAEVLLEAFGGNFFTKVKEMFQKLWAKIKSWYEAFIKSVKLIFMSGKKFIKEFKSELDRKTNKGYTYKSFDYKNDLSKVEAIEAAADKEVQAAVNKYSINTQAATTVDELVTSEKLAETKEALCSAIVNNATTPEEVASEMTELIFGDGSKTEFEDFENMDKGSMIKVVDTAEKTIADIETELKKQETRFNKIIKDTEAMAKKFKDDKEEEKMLGRINNRVEMLRFAVTLNATVVKTGASIKKRVAQDCEAVLKGYLRFKPVKESFAGEGETATQGILEAAMRFV